MFRSLLIANRGEISLRIQRTARRMGLRTIAVYSDADAGAPHVRAADAAVRIGPPAPGESYLNIGAILDAAKNSGADALHPGYGFLAERTGFAEAVLDAGLVWIGPPPAAMRTMGDKAQAKKLAKRAGAPVLPGYEGDDQSDAAFAKAASTMGFPLMLKAAAGGGGRGMRLVTTPEALPSALVTARSEAEHAFGDGRLLLERALASPRHVEVQIFADAHGNGIHLGERDCSVQRRHQKLIEESPSPAVDAVLRTRMGDAAVGIARAAGYVGAGTVEFLLGADGDFWFMEMNTRLQVEHPVTEAVTGIDLVEWQLRVAAGESLPLAQDAVQFDGHAIEARLCAEDPARDFLPQSGTLTLWQPTCGAVRVEHALESGCAIAPWYDSMIAKLIVHAPTRDAAASQLAAALDHSAVLGLETNKSYLAAVLRHPMFLDPGPQTDFVARHMANWQAPIIDSSTIAVAAALLVADSARRAKYGEWSSWSNSPARWMRIALRCADRTESAAVRHADGITTVEVGEIAIAVRFADWRADTVRAALDGGAGEPVTYARSGNHLDLTWRGASYRFTDCRDEPPARRSTATHDGRLLAPMNGRVVALPVGAGETVAADQAVIVLEAMKMEHSVTLGIAARVSAIHVAAGAQVGTGQLLLEFEALKPA